MASDWSSSETISAPNEITIKYKGGTPETDKTVKLSNITKSNSRTEYRTLSYTTAEGKIQTQDVAVFKRDTKTTAIASVNQSYVTYLIEKGLDLPSGNAETVTETTYEYRATSPEGPIKTKEITIEKISFVQFAGSLSVQDYEGYYPSTELVAVQKTEIVYESIKTANGRDITRTKTSRWRSRGSTQEGSQSAKEDLVKFAGFKATTGLNALLADDIIRSYLPFVFEGTDVETSTGRAPVPTRPSAQEFVADQVVNGGQNTDTTKTFVERYGNAGWTAYIPNGTDWTTLNKDSNGDGIPDWAPYVPDDWTDYDRDSNSDGVPDWAEYVPGDWQNYNTDSNGDGTPDWAEYVPVGWEEFDITDSDYTSTDITIDTVKSITGIVRFNGNVYDSAEDTVTATYEMPYSPSDYFIFVKKRRTLLKGNARSAAEAFGRTESALDIGHAYGQNIVSGFNEIPSDDLSPLYLRIAGIEGAFLCDSVSYAWGPEGMVVSSDLMLLGVTGYYGSSAPATSWLRLPVASTGLTAAGATTVEANPVKANSIAIPNDFSGATPASTLAQLPTNGSDVFAEWRQGANIIGPTLAVEILTAFSGPYLSSREFEYALTLEAETAVLMTGPFIESGEDGIIVSAITYSQSSTYIDNDPADNASMTNGIYAEATSTGTTSGSNWIQMDLGAPLPVATVYVGCDFDEVLAGGWDKTYTEDCDVEESLDGTTWSVLFNTGTFTTGIQSYTVSTTARYLRIVGTGFLCVTEFYATST